MSILSVHGWRAGDSIRLGTKTGWVTLVVPGIGMIVRFDSGSCGGTTFVQRKTLRRATPNC